MNLSSSKIGGTEEEEEEDGGEEIEREEKGNKVGNREPPDFSQITVTHPYHAYHSAGADSMRDRESCSHGG